MSPSCHGKQQPLELLCWAGKTAFNEKKTFRKSCPSSSSSSLPSPRDAQAGVGHPHKPRFPKLPTPSLSSPPEANVGRGKGNPSSAERERTVILFAIFIYRSALNRYGLTLPALKGELDLMHMRIFSIPLQSGTSSCLPSFTWGVSASPSSCKTQRSWCLQCSTPTEKPSPITSKF